MHYENILVPYDGSEHARRALGAAEEFALDNESATLTILSVIFVEPISSAASIDPMMGDAPMMPEDLETFRVLEADEIRRTKDGMREDAEGILTRLPSERVRYEVTDFPTPADGIADYVDSHPCDLVIMGRRGLSGLRGLLGSVATSVQKKVDVPVMTVK